MRGFTLVELLISIAIIGMITALVLVKYGSFSSTTLLKSTAYEIALTLREAQVKSVSVLGSDPNFDYPYGVTFSPNSKTYTAFIYKDTDLDAVPQYDKGSASPKATDIQTFRLDHSMTIDDV